jgi:DNA-binding response OmpR family regulator
MRVLIAEDDPGVRSVLARGLTEEGYVCDTATQGDDALHLLRIYDYAAAVLDWRMPGLTGEQVAREARRLKIRTPILMLTARDTTADKVMGLDAGADDYLVKPFQFEELLARLRALLRRPREVEEPVIARGKLGLDPARRLVTVGGSHVSITGVEFAILELLMRRSPAIVSRELIARHAWPEAGAEIGSNTIDVHMANLRRKLVDAGVQLLTVRGAGYRLVET